MAVDSQIWAHVWKMKMPNKIRVFAWRVCQNILPTRENLIRRKVVPNDYCERVTKAQNQFFTCYGRAKQHKTCGQELLVDYRR